MPDYIEVAQAVVIEIGVCNAGGAADDVIVRTSLKKTIAGID